MDLVNQNEQLRIENLDIRKFIPDRNRKHKSKGEFCPDCGETLRMEGRCRLCAYCGWSTCP